MRPLCPDEYGVFLGRQTHTLYFFQSQRNLRKVLNKIRQTDNRISCCYGKTGYRLWSKIGRFSFQIGRFSLFYQKSGDLPKNRETWKLCNLSFEKTDLMIDRRMTMDRYKWRNISNLAEYRTRFVTLLSVIAIFWL